LAINERLALEVTADTKGAVRGLNQVGDAAHKNLGATEQGISRVGSRSPVFGAALAGAGVVAAAGLMKAGQAAAQLEQSIGGTEAVFGEVSGTIDKFAKDAARNMGLSERAFREATTSIGGQLQGVGFDTQTAADQAVKLTGVAADLAATYGGTTADAVAALGAAFRGEADPAERFNLRLNQNTVNAKAVAMGLAESTSKVGAQAKAQATLALITEQSAKAQGQFAREADTATGASAIAAAQAENTAASLGDATLPIYTKVVGVVSEVASAFEKLPGPVQTGIIAFGGLAVAAGPLMRVGTSIQTVWKAVPGVIDKAAIGTYNAAGKLKGAIGLASVALAAFSLHKMFPSDGLGNQLDDLVDRFGGAKSAADSLSEAIREDGAAFGEYTQKAVEARIASLDLADNLAKAEVSFDDISGAASKYADASGDADEKTGLLARIMEDLGVSGSEAEGALRLLVIQMAAGRGEAGSLGEVFDEAAGKSDGLTDALGKQEEAMQGVLDATLALFDSNLGYRNSVDQVEDKVAELNELQAAGKVGTEEYSDGLRALEGDMLSQAAAAVRSAEDNATAAGATLTAADKAAIYKAELVRLKEQFPGLAAVIQGHIDKLGAIPVGKATTVQVYVPGQWVLDKMATTLDRISGTHEVNVRTNVFSVEGALARMNRAGGGPADGTGVWSEGPRGTDTIPAWLTPGEFVMSKKAVDTYGLGLMNAMNAQRFAQGGPVGRAASPAVPGGPTVTVQQLVVHTQAKDASQLARELLPAIQREVRVRGGVERAFGAIR
jgi:hypothetical protein